MLGNFFFRRSTDRKQRVNKKRNFEVDSPSSSGGQKKCMKKLASLGLHLKQHCKLKFSLFLLKNNFWTLNY
jgi:hypothetical protein